MASAAKLDSMNTSIWDVPVMPGCPGKRDFWVRWRCARTLAATIERAEASQSLRDRERGCAYSIRVPGEHNKAIKAREMRERWYAEECRAAWDAYYEQLPPAGKRLVDARIAAAESRAQALAEKRAGMQHNHQEPKAQARELDSCKAVTA